MAFARPGNAGSREVTTPARQLPLPQGECLDGNSLPCLRQAPCLALGQPYLRDAGSSTHPLSDPAVAAAEAFWGAAVCGITVTARLQLDLAVRGLRQPFRCSTLLFRECMACDERGLQGLTGT